MMAWSSTPAGEAHVTRSVALTCQDETHRIVVSDDGTVTLPHHDLIADISAIIMGSSPPPCLIVYLVLDFMLEHGGRPARLPSVPGWWLWAPEMPVVDADNAHRAMGTLDTVRTIIALFEDAPWCWHWERYSNDGGPYLLIDSRATASKIAVKSA